MIREPWSRAEPEPSRPERDWSWLVALLALGAYAWVLALPFQLDDYSHIRMAPHQLGMGAAADADAETPPATAERTADPDAPPPREYLFRPLFWALLLGLCRVQGAPLDPLWFHAAFWLLHALVAVLGYRVLRRLLPPAGALAGGIFIAVHHGAAQATSWIAAGSDVMVVLSAILATACLLRLDRRTSVAWAFLAGLFVALGLASKPITAIALAPLLLLALLAIPRGEEPRRRILDAAAFLVLPAAVFALRALRLGTWSLTYAGGSQANLDALSDMGQRVPSFAGRFLYPWNRAEAVSDLAPASSAWAWPQELAAESWGLDPTTAMGLLLLGLPILALLLSPRWYGGRAVLGAVLFIAVSLPALFLFRSPAEGGTDTNSLNRIFYTGLPVASFVFGGAVAALVRFPWRPVAWALGAPLVAAAALLSIDAGVHVARTELRVAGRIRSRLEAIEEVASQGAPPPTLLVVDAEPEYAGIPELGELVRFAVLPPFRAEPLSLHHAQSIPSLVDSGLLTTVPEAVQILHWYEGALIPKGPLLEPLPQPLPDLVPLGELATGLAWRPVRPLPSRAVPVLRFALAPGDLEEFRLEVEAERATFARDLDALPATAPRSLAVLIADDLSWLLAGPIREIRLKGRGLGERIHEAPHPTDRLPDLAVLSPPDGEIVPLGSHPVIEIGEVPRERTIRVRFDFVIDAARIPMIFRPRPHRLERQSEGSTLYRWRSIDPIDAGSTGGLDWSTLPDLWKEHLDPRGVTSLPLRWRVELLYADERSVAARSTWRSLILQR